MSEPTDEQLRRDVAAMKEIVRRDRPRGPYSFWTLETGWVRVASDDEADAAYLRRLRGDE